MTTTTPTLAPVIAPEGTEEKPKGKHLTKKQWAEIEALWSLGEITIGQLVKRYGKNKSTFTYHFDKKGIKKGDGLIGHKKRVADAVTDAALTDATIIAARIRETKEEHYKMASALAKLTWAEILRAKQDGVAYSTIQANLRSLDSAMTVLKKAREERWAVLGLDRPDAIDEDGLPELLITELTAEQIEELRAMEADEDPDDISDTQSADDEEPDDIEDEDLVAEE